MLHYTIKIAKAIFTSIRPPVTIGACFLTLAAFNPNETELIQVILLMVAAFFGSSYCFLANDIFDREKDVLNNKSRPIATGLLSVRVASVMCVVFASIFIIATWFLGTIVFALSFLFLFIASIYSYINQRNGFFANLIVAFMVSSTQWGVGILKPDEFLWLTSVFLFFYTIPREILLDWLDMPGDKNSGKSSIPLIYSTRYLKRVITFLSITSIFSLVIILYTTKPDTILFWLIGLACLFCGVSFVPFLKRPDENGTMLSVKASHLPYLFLILALFFR